MCFLPKLIFLLLFHSNYAAVAADTFSSELGILSRSKPRLLTSWNFREVPPGTNGGVSFVGTLAGFGGAFVIAITSWLLLPLCRRGTSGLTERAFVGSHGWGWSEQAAFVLAVTVWGGLGSLLDSVLGGFLQESVVDARTGKVVEGIGGKKVCLLPAICSVQEILKRTLQVPSATETLRRFSFMAFMTLRARRMADPAGG